MSLESNMDDKNHINFDAPATLRKWPSIKNQRASATDRPYQQAALGTGEISSNVAGVQQAAGDTGAAAHQVLQASGELSRQSETMRGQVESFLSNIKAA